MMTAGWPNILWQHIILQITISGHMVNIFWGQLNVLLVCLTIQIKRGVLWDPRDLWCGFSACASLNSRVTSAISRVYKKLRPKQHKLDAPLDFEWRYSFISITIALDAPWVSNSAIMQVAGKWPVSAAQCKRKTWFIRHLSDGLYIFHINLWNLPSDIWA